MFKEPKIIYYRAAGKSLQAYNTIIERHADAKDALRAWAGRFGAEDASARGALRFEGTPPAPWTPIRGNHGGWCHPSGRTKEGRAIVKEAKNLPRIPTTTDLTSAMGLSEVIRITGPHSLRTYTVGARRIGTEVFLSVFANDDGTPSMVPPDAEQVPTSTYHLACEAAGVDP